MHKAGQVSQGLSSKIARLQQRLLILSRFPQYIVRKCLPTQSLEAVYISEGQDWVIRDIGETLRKELDKIGFPLKTTTSTRFLAKNLIHFGSLHMFLTSRRLNYQSGNKIMATFYHGREGIDPELDRSIKLFKERKNKLTHLIVSNSIVKKRVIDWGMSPERVSLIPIGFHLERFYVAEAGQKEMIRERLGIPKNVFCIGSFQKDSEGWGEGTHPKYVKGPDVFVELMARLQRKRPVMALLTGPSRGYVKTELSKLGVPFVHHYLKNPSDLGDFYRALDAYVISSREEGGPIAIMESLQSGIPLVSTKVGMTIDVLRDGENALLSEVDDVNGLEQKCHLLMESSSFAEKIRSVGPPSVAHLSWTSVAQQYAQLYKSIMMRES